MPTSEEFLMPVSLPPRTLVSFVDSLCLVCHDSFTTCISSAQRPTITPLPFFLYSRTFVFGERLSFVLILFAICLVSGNFVSSIHGQRI